MERMPYKFSENFIGNWDLLKEVLQNKNTVFVYDMDLVHANSAKVVLKDFTKRTGIKSDPLRIDYWDYLTDLAIKSGLSDEDIKHAEDGWYNPDVLRTSPRYPFTRSLVNKTLKLYGAENNYILTSRNPDLRKTTIDWYKFQFPEILSGNILMRTDDNYSPVQFKIDCIWLLSKNTPWLVYVDDYMVFSKAVVESGIENCLVINVPIGDNIPELRHERLFYIKRYPLEIQSMYPLFDAVDRATK